MKCNLCKIEKKLKKKSHIISDFFFKSLYNNHSRLVKFDVVQMFNGIDKQSLPPTSTYEKHILCAKCDNEIINRYESYYAKNVFYGDNFKKSIFSESGKINHYEYNNLDFNLANIFFLTLLWRANLSNQKSFSEVNLSSDLERSIRRQILSGNYNENSVKITAFKFSENSNFRRSVSQFKNIESYYTIILRDLILFFHVEKDQIYRQIKNHKINKNGSWILPEIPKSYEEEFLMSYINPQRNV